MLHRVNNLNLLKAISDKYLLKHDSMDLKNNVKKIEILSKNNRKYRHNIYVQKYCFRLRRLSLGKIYVAGLLWALQVVMDLKWNGIAILIWKSKNQASLKQTTMVLWKRCFFFCFSNENITLIFDNLPVAIYLVAHILINALSLSDIRKN